MKRLLLCVLAGVLLPAVLHAQAGCVLQQSTASQEISIGRFVDSADGNTQETGLTINASDIRLKKGAADWAAKNSGGATHEEAGNYRITLDATDTATLGILEIAVHVSGALSVEKTCLVVPSGSYSFLVSTGPASAPTNFQSFSIDGNGRIDVIKVAGTTQTAGDIVADTNDIQTRIPVLAVISGTADSGTTTTMVDAARTEATNDWWKGQFIRFTSGTLLGQMALITGFTASSDTVTFAPAVTTAVTTHTYEFIPSSRVDLHSWLGTVVATPATAGIPDINVKNIDNDAASAAATVTFPTGTIANTTNITTVGAVSGAVGSVTGSVGSVSSGLKTFPKNVAASLVVQASTSAGVPVTGATPSCSVSRDGAALSSTGVSNGSEIATIGSYTINLTSGAMNGNVLVLSCTFSGGSGSAVAYKQFLYTQQ